MHFHLVVTSPFGDHAVGDLVTDPDTVDELLQHSADRVLRIAPVTAAASAAKED